MKNNTSHLAPFFVGEKVVPTDKAVKDYRHLAKVWNLPYPDKDEVCVVLSIAPHPKHDFWLVRGAPRRCSFTRRNFAIAALLRSAGTLWP